MITHRSVELIREAARVEEVVGDFVTLKRRGTNMIGLCPFHHEKTPSFNVSPARNIYKCFGCGKAGDPIQFLIDYENLNFDEALRYLAKKYHVEVEETFVDKEHIEERQKAESLFLVNEYAKNFYTQFLFETERGQTVGLSYFKQRGFREDTIRKFSLGLAPADKDAFTKAALKDRYDAESLKKLGLTSQYNSDFFRDRAMFPVFNLTGKVIAFGGRILQKDPKAPKYINSPETEIYVKSKSLYGIFQAKKAIQQADECILVEGYTDVVSLHQAGVENAVSSSGTSLTPDQIRIIRRFTPNIKIIYDGDAAGVKAALRGLDLILEEDMNLKVVLLPDAQDPDSFMQSVGLTAFRDFIARESQDFIFFKLRFLLKEAGTDPVKRSQLVKEIFASVAKIPDVGKRSFFSTELFNVLRNEGYNLSETIIQGEINKLVNKNIEHKRKGAVLAVTPLDEAESSPPDDNEAEKTQKNDRSYRDAAYGEEAQEKQIAEILVNFGNEIFDKEQKTTIARYILDNIEDVVQYFDHPVYKKVVFESMELLRRGLPVETGYFVNHPASKDIRSFAANALIADYAYADWERKGVFLETQPPAPLNFLSDARQSLFYFKYHKILKVLKNNQEQYLRLTKEGDHAQATLHLKIQQKLLDMKKQIAKELNITALK